MSEPRFPQGDDSQIERLQAYKYLLQDLKSLLLTADIERLSYTSLGPLRENISAFLKEIDDLKRKKQGGTYFHSINAIYINVRDALSELAVAQRLLQAIQEEGTKVTEIAESVRQVHKSFMLCQDYLDEALQQFGTEFF